MLKKLLVASTCLLLSTTLVMGEEQEKDRFFKISGGFNAGYKVQTDHRTPWTRPGEMTQASGNRSNQQVTSSFILNFMAMKFADGSTSIPEFMVYSQLRAKPNDPDVERYSSTDSTGNDPVVNLGEAFILWKPHMALNVIAGRHTVVATMNRGHNFWGPVEFSVANLASTNTENAGLTVSAFLGSADHSAGISMINGAPKISDLYNDSMVGHEDEGSEKTTIMWYEGSLLNKALKIKAAQQTIAVNKSLTTSAENITSHDETESHTVLNVFAKYDIGFIAPWVGYYTTSGKTADGADLVTTVNTLGFEMKDLGPGNLAFEYTTMSTPEFGETGSAGAVVDLKSITSLDYTIEMAKKIALTLTYRQITAGDYFTKGEGSTMYGGALQAYAWTPTNMMAASINY